MKKQGVIEQVLLLPRTRKAEDVSEPIRIKEEPPDAPPIDQCQDIQQTTQPSRKGTDKDMYALQEAPYSNHEELSNKLKCSRNSSHPRHTTKLNWIHSLQDLTGNEFTNRVISTVAYKDLYLLFEEFQSHPMEFGFQTNYPMFLRHQGFKIKSVIQQAEFQLRDSNFTSPWTSSVLDSAYSPFKPILCNIMKRPASKLTWALKRDLSWIQNAQDHRIFQRESQDINNCIQRSYFGSSPTNWQLSLKGSMENYVWQP